MRAAPIVGTVDTPGGEAVLSRLAEAVAAWFLQWLPVEMASLANVPWGGGGEPSAEEADPDAAERQGKRQPGGADEPQA